MCIFFIIKKHIDIIHKKYYHIDQSLISVSDGQPRILIYLNYLLYNNTGNSTKRIFVDIIDA